MEEQVGQPWRTTFNELLSGGVTVGVDLPSQGLVVLFKAKDAKCAAQAYQALYDLALSEAAEHKRLEPVKQEDYREIANYRIGEAEYAVLGSYIVLTNKNVLLRFIIDHHLDGGKSLNDDEQFQTARQQRAADLTSWLYVDLRMIHLLAGTQKALSKKSDNPAAELLVGGILGAIPNAPYVTASLEVETRHIKLNLALPCDTKAIAKTREFYVGPEGNGMAPALLQPKETLLTLSSYRDFFSLWRNAPDLFNDKVNAQFAETESKLTTIFAGRNFRDDILGNLEPGMQLVVARQRFAENGIVPAIKLPSAAVVFRMKKPEETTRIFKVTYQSLIGFLNVAGAMNGLAPLDVNSEKTNFGLVVSAEYLPPEKMVMKQEAPINFNASPTIAFAGDRFILASSKTLAQELAALAPVPAEKQGINTLAELKGAAVRQVLADNREPLIAQNMLEKGHDQAAAEKEVEILMHIVEAIQGAKLSLTTQEKMLRLALEVNLVPGK